MRLSRSTRNDEGSANGIPNESGFFSGFRFARSRYVYSKGLDI
jgi:hypothetical protein